MNFLRRYYSQLLFLIIGILIGFFISRLPIQFEAKTNWIAFANFFLTILLALYLEFVVRPSFSNNRNEKDLLIDQLNDIRKEIVSIHEKYSETRKKIPIPSEDKNEIVTKFRSFSNLIDMLKQSDEYCSITRKSEMSDNIFKLYLEYKKSLTGHGFNKEAFSYDRLYWKNSETQYKNLLTCIMHSIIDVNKL